MYFEIISASFVGLFVPAMSYYWTKKKDREGELRKEKLEHYKEFASCLSGVVGGNIEPKSQKAYSLIRNKLKLIAPYSVIQALKSYDKSTDFNAPKEKRSEHNALLSTLFYEIRKDLGVLPKDNPNDFKIYLSRFD